VASWRGLLRRTATSPLTHLFHACGDSFPEVTKRLLEFGLALRPIHARHCLLGLHALNFGNLAAALEHPKGLQEGPALGLVEPGKRIAPVRSHSPGRAELIQRSGDRRKARMLNEGIKLL